MVEATPSMWTPPDQAARDRIRRDLGTNLLVEAGAGSGKTTAMVGRMIELVRTGTATVDQIAAVTFTRKAAGELRERFQETLEREFRLLEGDPARRHERECLQVALDGLGRCFVGTIHSFCGRLLRERPLEAGVPPDFEEISGAEEERVRWDSWSRFLERVGSPRSRLGKSLDDIGVEPDQLKDLFRELSDNPDVRYPGERVPRPGSDEIEKLGAELALLVDKSELLLPKHQPSAGWDRLQKKLNKLVFSRKYPGWTTELDLLEALSTAAGTKNELTQNRWGDDKATKAAAKALGQRWEAFCGKGTPAHALHERWMAHKYPLVLRFARAAAGVYAAERRRRGLLNFQDLLMVTADLLRANPEVRRELGTHFRYLLVDEFQDTDPIQAEVVFLLASEPSGEPHWTLANPRPGALFVVGDPKQSIYRFRRADIAVYGQTKRRFRQIGDVVGLTANFRSAKPVEAFVNAVFEAVLPAEENGHQAAFAPLQAAPVERPLQGVTWFEFNAADGKGKVSGRRVAEPESILLASWVADRIERDGRKPADFLILTRTRAQLATYAKALEARNIPVQVTGAVLRAEDELKDLVLILKALCDPGNPVLTLAVLEGLFYGLSHGQLYAHVRLGGRFSFLTAEHPAGSPAANGLAQLREFWLLTRSLPADVAVPAIVERLGALPHAAAGELGSSRAGALLYAIEVIRAAGMDGATSLAEAIEVVETALMEEADAPLFPGESDAVRVMNLHKAKGLEAPVVVLAFPSADREYPIPRHITRGEDGRAIGYVKVMDSSWRWGSLLAKPLQWDAYEAAEKPFLDAEEVRLLYVAATRAGDELVVARCLETQGDSVWKGFHARLDDATLAARLVIEPRPPVSRQSVETEAATIQRRTTEVNARRAALAIPSYASASVTTRAKGSDAFRPGSGDAAGRGVAWGRAVHRAMDLATQSPGLSDLERACRRILVEEERPVDNVGAPLELAELVELVETLRRSALWRRSQRASRVLAEAPFLISFSGEEAVALGILEPQEGKETCRQIVEGVIDLAFRRDTGGWVIADYKTDRFASAEARLERTAAYKRQVDLYAHCWQRLTGESVDEKVLFFTHDQSEISW